MLTQLLTPVHTLSLSRSALFAWTRHPGLVSHRACIPLAARVALGRSYKGRQVRGAPFVGREFKALRSVISLTLQVGQLREVVEEEGAMEEAKV